MDIKSTKSNIEIETKPAENLGQIENTKLNLFAKFEESFKSIENELSNIKKENSKLKTENKKMFSKQLELEVQLNNHEKTIIQECDKILNLKMICLLCSIAFVIIIYGIQFISNPQKNVTTQQVLGAMSAIGLIYTALEKIIPHKDSLFNTH